MTLAAILYLASVTLAAPEPVAAPQLRHPDRLFQLEDLPKATLLANGRKVPVWVVSTPKQRGEGMMFLKDRDVPKGHGMLFVFPQAIPLSFWMKNTYIPLDIAYLDASGKVLNTEAMKPHDETGVPSRGPALYALEMKRGEFARLGIRTGTKVTIPKNLSAKS